MRRAGLALLAGLVAVCASVVQGHATVSTPTPTGNFAGGRDTSADGVMVKGSTAISAADANFTTGDVGFGVLAQGIPAGATIAGVTSSTQATLSVAATRNTSTAIFAIAGANAALYGWGDATELDGSILVGDYWNNRIVHYNANGTPATPFVFTKSTVGFGTNTNQAPFGICVDNSSGPFRGDVYMTEGSLYNVIQYDPNGNWVTSWGTTKAAHSVAFDYPSQCVVNPTSGLVYISNQFAKSIVILNPSTNAASIVSPPSPNTFIQPRGLAFDGLGNIWIADQGHHRVDIYSPSCLANPWPIGSACSKPIKEVTPPGGVNQTTFDMRGLAIDITAPATTLTPTAVPLMFVTNGQNCLVQEFNADPTNNYVNVGFLTNFNNGNLVSGSNCGTPGVLAANGQFEDGARGLAIDGNHDVWAGDLGDFRTQVFDENGNWLNNVPGYWPGDNGGTSPPSVPAGGGFNGPRGVAFDSGGNMYVTDMYNERIQEFSPTSNGWALNTTLNSGTVTPGAWGMRGDGPGQMNYPRLLCWDPLTVTGNGTGALIAANTDSNMIVAWNPNRVGNPPSVVWDSITGLADPYGVACDTDPTSPGYGLIYIANSNGKDIVVLNPDGTPAATTNTMGAGSIVGFTRGITVDTDGTVWVDTGTASHVYHFASFKDPKTPGALLSQSDFTASSGGSAACNPFGLAATANYLYVACPSTNNVVYYAKHGTTLPPTFQAAFSSYNAFGLVGTMRTPQGLAIGPNGDLYVVEENNGRVSEWQVPQ